MRPRSSFEVNVFRFGSRFFVFGMLLFVGMLTWKLWQAREPISPSGWPLVVFFVLFPFLHLLGLRGRFVPGVTASLFHVVACVFIGWVAVLSAGDLGKNITVVPQV